MTEKLSPEDVKHRDLFYRFALNPGLAAYTRATLSGKPVSAPPDEPSQILYSRFINDEVTAKSPKQLSVLYAALHEYEELMHDYDDDDYSRANFRLEDKQNG